MAKQEQTPAAAPKRKPTIEVLERRAAGVDVYGQGTPAIQLKEPGWDCRWFNSELAADHVWRAKHQKGWENVRPEELQDAEQIGGYQLDPAGHIVRGERGREVLLKMPTRYRNEIQKRKTEQNIRNMRPGVMKREVAEAAGKALGDQAASFIERDVKIIGDVTDKREVIHRGSELE